MPTRREVLSAACALGATSVLGRFAFAQTGSAPKQAATPVADSENFLSYVNPKFRAAAEQMGKMFGNMPPLSAQTLPGLREGGKKWTKPLLPSPEVTERSIPGAKGAPPVKVYMVGNAQDASKPAILHIHGGGYIAGSAESSRRDIQQLALDHDCVAVTVEYRLAPETKFPGSLEDNYAALLWMYKNAKELGIDTKKIAIKGESAGGGHAAALAIAARDRKEVPICLQVLIYPMLDDRTGSTKQLPPQFGKFGWTPQQNRFGWESLLGVTPGSANVPQGSVPAREADLSGLAPAFIGVGSIDLFAPEDVEYGNRLMLAGVPVEMLVIPGAFHGFNEMVPQASLSKQFNDAWNAALKRAFQQP